MHVCQTAVDALADSSKFPEQWLFKHRWGKGKKDAPTSLPNGEKITFLKVGGRTSCVVPSVQKKTGAVAGDMKDDDSDSKTSRKRKTIADEIEPSDAADSIVEVEASRKAKGKRAGKKPKNGKASEIELMELGEVEIEPKVAQKAKQASAVKAPPPSEDEASKGKAKKSKATRDPIMPTESAKADPKAILRRRSGRVSK